MDNFDISKPSGNKDLNKPIPFDDDLNKPIPFDDGDTKMGVSHSPLNLSGGAAVKVPAPTTKERGEKIVSSDRITGVKTFFTKLHPGAIEFLTEQINDWLKANPGIDIKRTNTTTGNVVGKKTEPNIIVMVWY